MFPNPLHFDRICRICLSNPEQLLNLFKVEEDIRTLLISMTAVSMSPSDELPQNICPFCLHQIKTTHYFILKCQESDRKIRLSLTNLAVKRIDTDNVDDEFIDNEVSEFECIAADKEENELNQTITILQSEQGVKDEQSSEILAKQLDDNIEIFPVVESKASAQHKPPKTENICPICNKSFSTLKSLERHKAMHEKHKTIETTFQCTVCGKQMKHINHFQIHMRSHRGGGASDNDQSISSTSLPSESGKKKYLCSTCGRACTSQSNLAVHIRRHTGTMTNFCKVCGKGYPRSTDLTIHMRKHTGERPFVCSICCRCFARSDKLTIHVRTHTGERPYTCTGCSRSFAQRNDLLTHQRRNVCGSNKLKKDAESTNQSET